MTSYRLFDEAGNQLELNDLQDKPSWCSVGVQLEEAFLKKFGKIFDLTLNEEKLHDPTAPDFFHENSGRYVDLKTQNTPFFQADRYLISPQYAVTFNDKDLRRYTQKYPTIIVLFYVEWICTKIIFDSGKEIKVQPMVGLWAGSLSRIALQCNSKNYHAYSQRKKDRKGNAKGSYVLDLRQDYLEQKI